MDTQKELRKQLLDYLQGKHVHAMLDDALKNLSAKLMNAKAPKVPYSFWALIEHVRITQDDIIDFILHPNYKYKNWPKDYWPSTGNAATKKDWDKTINKIKKDFQLLIKIVKNPKTDLLAKIPHGEGQTIFREAILIIDHNAYHIGEFILMRRALGVWKS